MSNIEVNRQDNSFVKEKNDKKDKLVNEKMETELESLFQQLCTNLEENNQLNDLFLRFFQTKTKLAFLFDEKEYKLILMKFLAFFNELIIKINNASSSKIYHPTEKDYSTYQTSESLINCYDEYTHYNQNPTRHFENITNNQIYKNSYAELPYNSYNVIPTYQSTNNLNTLDNQYSPNPNEKLFPKNNKKMHEEKKVNFYGDLSNSNFNLTKYEPSKKDICIFMNNYLFLNVFFIFRIIYFIVLFRFTE